MSSAHRVEIAVIGAGVVGLAIAHRLALAGHEVLLLDPNPPGSGASWGNAGTIADYAVLPVGTPAVLRNLPSLLFNLNSPLALRRAAILATAPWLLRFLRQSLPAAAARNAAAIAALLADASPRWQALAAKVGGADQVQARGCLYLYDSAAAVRAAGKDLAVRRSYGITADLLGPADLALLEPGLPPAFAGAALFPKALFLSDPGMMVAILAASARAAGVQHRPIGVRYLMRQQGHVVLRGDDQRIEARRVVIAAGAHSRALAWMAGDRVPLETERGYHVEYDMAAPRLSRPACPTRGGFYLCPMTGRLRVAGTVELGGMDPEPSPHRIALLDKGARAIFPDLPTPSRSWLGFRPSMPDSLPVIGPGRLGPEVIHAFGHGHIGVTLAPITAAIVAALIAGQTPPVDIAPYRATRF